MTDKEKEILRWIYAFTQDRGVAPNQATVAKCLGMSRSRVGQVIRRLPITRVQEIEEYEVIKQRKVLRLYIDKSKVKIKDLV